MADWSNIKTEYITTETSYRELSQKYGVHYTNIAKRASKEGWQQLRQQHTTRTQTKMVDAVERRKADRAARLMDVSDLLLEKVRKLIDSDDKIAMDTQGMKHISGVLKDLKEIQMIRSEPDIREQEARIAKLWREAEKDAGDKDKTVIVTIEGGDDSWRK